MRKRKPHKHEDSEEDLHVGVSVVSNEDGIGLAVTRPHKVSECGEAIEAAEQELLGHETVYEAEDAATTRASVGYSKSYAANFDSVFGKN